MKVKYVYIAAPYSGGDTVINVRRAVMLGVQLREMGYVPIIPHLSMLSHLISPKEYDFWLAWDFDLLELCDVLLRLEGDSPGADQEVEYMTKLGKPVYLLSRENDWRLEDFVQMYPLKKN